MEIRQNRHTSNPDDHVFRVPDGVVWDLLPVGMLNAVLVHGLTMKLQKRTSGHTTRSNELFGDLAPSGRINTESNNKFRVVSPITCSV